MFTLPILPAEMRVSLDPFTAEGNEICRYGGVAAVVRPLGLDEQSAWRDAFPDATRRSQAATALVFQQLVRMDGLAMTTADGAVTAFDPANAEHRRSMPEPMRTAIYLALIGRSVLGEDAEKNCDLPSDSGGTSGTDTSSAAAAPTASATS